MNSITIDKNPNYKEIYKFIKEKFDKTTHFKHGPFDETYYTLGVYESAKEIIEKLNKSIKKEQVLVACLLHDIGKTRLKPSRLFSKYGPLEKYYEEWNKHSEFGVAIAKRYLLKQGYSKRFVDDVCFLIKNHDKRGIKLKDNSLELQIIQDADLIADIGFAGFIRPFLYCGKFINQSVINSIEYLLEEDKKRTKMKLNLKVSMIIAAKKSKIQSNLVKEISKELDSVLLQNPKFHS